MSEAAALLAQLRQIDGTATIIVRNGIPTEVRWEGGAMPITHPDVLLEAITDLRWGEIDVQVEGGQLKDIVGQRVHLRLVRG